MGGFTVFFNMFCVMGISVAMPVIAVNVWKMTSVQVGVLEATFPLGMLLGSLVMYIVPEAKSSYRRIMSCIAAASIVMLSLGILASDELFTFDLNVYFISTIVLLIILAVSSVSYNIPFYVSLQRNVLNEILGRVRSVILAFVTALSPIGALIGGLLVDVVDPWLLPFVCGVVMIILTVFMFRVKVLKSI